MKQHDSAIMALQEAPITCEPPSTCPTIHAADLAQVMTLGTGRSLSEDATEQCGRATDCLLHEAPVQR